MMSTSPSSSHDHDPEQSMSSSRKNMSISSDDSGSYAESRLNPSSSSSSPDNRTKEYLFPHSHKDNVKAPNVTVIHPSAQHPLFGGRVPGAATFPSPFAAPSSLARQHEEFLRHSLMTSSHRALAGPNASVESRAFGASGVDGAHLSSAHAHMQHLYLQNYYAAAALQHHLQRSRLAGGEMSSRLGAMSRFAPYVIPHSQSINQLTSQTAHNSDTERERGSPNSHDERLSPIASASSRHGVASNDNVTSLQRSLPSSPLNELNALRRETHKSSGSENVMKGHSSRTNKFSIESLTAKD